MRCRAVPGLSWGSRAGCAVPSVGLSRVRAMIGRMSLSVPGVPARPARRAVLTGGLGAASLGLAALSLAACGIRLEDDAPRVPLVPTRKPVPGEAFMVALWHSSSLLGEQAGALGGAASALPARIAALHRRQVDVLGAELSRLGVPQKVLDDAKAAATATSGPSTTGPSTTGPSPTSTSSATASGATTGGSSSGADPTTGGGPEGLAAAERADAEPDAFTSLAAVPAAVASLFGAALAQRLAAAQLLGGTSPTTPAPTWEASTVAASFLSTTRAAVYAFEIVAAQSRGGAQQTLAASTLTSLQARARVQESLAGSSAAPAPLGYDLPTPVSTPAAARTLAVSTLTGLRSACALEVAAAGQDPGPLASAVQWLADTEVLASRWGVALAPFPGLA